MYLYEKGEVTARDIMTTKYKTVTGDLTLAKCINIIAEEDIEELLIINNNVLISVITNDIILDIIYSTHSSEQDKILISQYRPDNQQDILTVTADEKADFVRDIMIKNKTDFAVVVKDKLPVGIIKYKNIVDKLYTKLKEINEFLLLTLNNIHEAVCIVDSDKIVRFWSRRGEELYGIKAQKIVGNKLEEFFPDALLLEVVDKKKPIENIFLSPKKGSYVILSGVPLFKNGILIGAVTTDRDVTEVANITLNLEKASKEFADLKIKDDGDNDNYFNQILGESVVIKDTIKKANRIAPTNSSVVITGETGTGKELFARSIHKASKRKGAFIPVNCSAIPKNLFESEMFGYVEGAFTGASPRGKDGKFKFANNGTLFLDEIGEMPLFMQAKLLRVLQDQQFIPIGGKNPINVNVRVISATNSNLEQMVTKDNFREDLYYRLNVVNIDLPSLRERKEDIPILVNHYIREYCRDNNIFSIPEISPEVLKVLMNYDWKGNVRELKNTTSYLVLFARKGKVTIESIPDYILQNTSTRENNDKIFDLQSCVSKTEINKIREVMIMTDGNKSKAARILNIPRSTLYYKIELYGLQDLK